MRFAYIDSNGNEVPIPSVDALALRIELGAISEDTELYDAQADLWGPAHTHEIFHTLSRTSGGDSGFVAPPPVVPPPAAPEPAVEEEAPMQDPDPADEAVAEAEEPVAEAEEPDDGLTLLEEGPATDGFEVAEEDEADAEAAGGLPDLDLELAPTFDPVGSEPDEAPLDLSSPSASIAEEDQEDEGGGMASFDFGDMEGGLELEALPEEGAEPLPATPVELAPDVAPTDSAGGSSDFSGGLELESAMDFGSGDFDDVESGSLQLETPMSEFSPESPPAWMDPDGSGTEDADAVMDFSSVGGESEADVGTDEAQLRDRRTPRNKPSAPKHRRQSSLAGPIVGVMVLLLVGVGGYLAWPVLSERLSGSNEPDAQPVFIPELRSELMPQMRSTAEAALAETFANVHRVWVESNAVGSPSSDWLAGVYLGNAGRFDDVEAFWNGMENYLAGVQAIDLVAFDTALRGEVGSLGVSEADASLILARADSGFVAGELARGEVHDRVAVLIGAALDLHAFLVANESNIAYVPASSITTDPVLEASPSTPEIRTAMEDLIDAVTGALGDLNYLALVTSEGLWATVLTQVQGVSIQ